MNRHLIFVQNPRVTTFVTVGYERLLLLEVAAFGVQYSQYMGSLLLGVVTFGEKNNMI